MSPSRAIPSIVVIALVLGAWAAAGATGPTGQAAPAAAPVPEGTATFYATMDAWVDEGAPNANHGGDSFLDVALTDKGNHSRTLIQFDVSGLPAGATVDSATLWLDLTATSGADPYYAYPMRQTGSWSEGSVTWNLRPAVTSDGDPAGPVGSVLGTISWDVTGIARQWALGAKNYGLALAGDDKAVGLRGFSSKEGKTRPSLVIKFTEPTITPTRTRTPTVTGTATGTVTASRTPTPTATVQPLAKSDLGDAPDSTNSFGLQMHAYPRVRAEFPSEFGPGSPPNGPLHKNDTLQYYLGQKITGESEADSGPDEDALNNIMPDKDGPNFDGGDDGVDMKDVSLGHCKLISLTFYVTSLSAAPVQAHFNAWADWDRNGKWGDQPACTGALAAEWAVQNMAVSLPGPGYFTFQTPAFLAYDPDPSQDLWLRATLSEQKAVERDGSGPAGGYAAGETEDYLVAGIPPTPTPTPTATPTRTPKPDIDFGIAIPYPRVTLALDWIVSGSQSSVRAITFVPVSVVGAAPAWVELDVKGAPAGVLFGFSPSMAAPPYTSTLTITARRDQVPAVGSYDVMVVGFDGTRYHEVPLRVEVNRTLYGDLSITSGEAVQVVEGASAGAPLVKMKATAFKLHVNSTFTGTVYAMFDLGLSYAQWTAILLIPPVGRAAAASAPEGPYPETWGEYAIAPGDNVVLLPKVFSGQEDATRDTSSNPAGIIRGVCWGPGGSGPCTIDTRYAPRPNANPVSFSVDINSDRRVSETDPSNNHFVSSPQPVVTTRPWRFLFYPSDHAGSAPAVAQVRAGAKNLVEYLVAVNPIADTKVVYDVSNVVQHWTAAEANNRWAFLNRVLTAARLAGFDYAVSVTPGCGGGGTCSGMYATEIGGICSANDPALVTLAHEFLHGTMNTADSYSLDTMVSWDESYCQLPDGTRQYCAWTNTPIPPGSAGRFCDQPNRSAPPECRGYWTKTTLVSCGCSPDYARDPALPCVDPAPPAPPLVRTTPTQCRDLCRASCSRLGGRVFGGPDCRTMHPASPGLWVNRWLPADTSMNHINDCSRNGDFPFYWQPLRATYSHSSDRLENDGWQNLTRSGSFLRATDPGALLVRGSVTQAGVASFDPFIRLDAAILDLEPGAVGAYQLRLVDGKGQMLGQTAFDLSFRQSDPFGGPVDTAYFSDRVEWREGTRRIELLKDGTVLESREVSQHAPQVALTAPAWGTGFRIGRNVPLHWTASDADGDSLSFAVTYSADDGKTWLPSAIDLSGAAYELPTEGLTPGTAFRVKVTATDGVNTAVAVSEAFALEQPSYLPLVLKQ